MVVCRIPVGIMSLLALKCTQAVIAAASHVADDGASKERELASCTHCELTRRKTGLATRYPVKESMAPRLG